MSTRQYDVLDIRLKQQLDGFNFDVELAIPLSGVTAIYGPSGSGKTTLLRGIAGLERTLVGEIHLGKTAWQNSTEFLPTHLRELAYVFQEPSLFNHLSVKGNLQYGLNRRSNKNTKLFQETVALLGIEHLLERDPNSLSGGEKQRVAIARAICSQPKLILMDEPLASLDTKRKQEVLPFLDKLHQELEIPIVYVSHALDEVIQLADHLVLLEQGSVVASGQIEEILTNLELPLSQEKDVASVLSAKLVAHDSEYGLSYLRFSGGQFSVPKLDMEIGSKVRIRLAAKDVSITLKRPEETSILNIFEGIISDFGPVETSQAIVKVLAGDSQVLAKLTQKSVDQLALSPGKKVFVQAKSVAVVA